MTNITAKKYLPFAILFVAMLLVFLSAALAFDVNVDNAVADENEELYVKVTCANLDSNGWAIASSGNKITLKIGIYNASGTAVGARKSVGVNYKTEDNTAIAAAYDYTAASDTMYFNVDEKEKSLGIQISTTPFATYTTGTTKYNTRNFFFRLISLTTDDENISISASNSSITCRLNYTYAYKTETVDGKVIFSEYYNTQSQYVSLSSDNHDDDYAWFNAYDENATVKNWWKYFKETGMASVAGTGKFVLDENGALQNDTRYYFYVGDKSVMKIEEDGYIYDDTDLDLTRIWDHSYGGSHGHSNIEWGSSSVPSASDPRVIYRTSDKDWWYLPADSNEKPKCAIEQCPDGGSTDRHCKGYLYMVPIDTSPLKVKNWYVDTEDKKITSDNLDPNRNILRVYMRFNEPVQIVGTAPKLEYSINMALSSRTYTMDYIGGAGTDTLVFGLDLSTFDNNIEIKSIHPMKVINGSNIKDYGYAMGLHSYLSGSNTLIPTSDQPGSSGLKTYFDARTPSIKPPTLPKEGTVLASHTIEVTVNSMPLNQQNNEQSGKLYYVWSQSATVAPAASEFTQEIPRYNGSDTTFRFTTGGLTGNWYLWLRAVSYVGKTAALSTGVGPYHFDNQAPTVKNVTVSSHTQAVQEHHFEFDLENVPVDCASKIETVRLIYSQSPIWVEGETELNERIIYSTAGTVAPGYVLPTTVDASTTHWQFDLNYKWFGVEDNSYGKFYFQIVAQDALGNTLTPAEYTPTKTASGEPLQVNYDSRSLIQSSHIWQDAVKISEDDSQPVIDIENISTKTPKLVITLSDLTIDAADEYTFTIEKPNVDNQLERVTTYTKANKDTCPWFSFALSGNTITITAKNISTLNGYYDVGFSILKNGSDLKFIENISFYFSHGYGVDEPANYSAISKGNLLINELYMMGSSALYYYKDADGATQYETYGQAVFSTASAAMNYIRFLEYQDLSLYVIPSDAAAQDLTNGFGSYVMADGYYGSKTAHKGEIWIRYKAKTWVDSGANSAWRYYYYKPAGSSQTIDVNNLGSDGILNDAIDTVVRTIFNNSNDGKGCHIGYLTSDSGLDKNGIPYLDASRVHYESKSVTKSRTGSALVGADYSGDPNIYSNTVVYNDKDYMMASYFTYGDYTKLYYSADGGVTYNRVYKENGSAISQFIHVSGPYIIRELDENGMRDYYVFADCDAPHLEVSLKTAQSDDYVTRTLDDSTSDRTWTFYGQSFVLGEIDRSEYDDYSYVAVFNRIGNGRQLKAVYTKSYLQSDHPVLTNGRFIVEVYDRTGNYYTINLFLNSTPLEVNIRENINVSLNVRVNNRSSSDISSYLIYLDGKLLENLQFESQKILRESGTYTFYIADFYGNVFSQEYNFYRKTPQVTWRFANEAGSITTYQPGIEGMSINAVGSQTYSVLSRGMVSFTYPTSDSYEYEFILDEGETLSVSSTTTLDGTRVVTVKEEKSWSIKIYYKDYPEIYAIYNITIDKTAPKISVSYQKSSYSHEEDNNLNGINGTGSIVRKATGSDTKMRYHEEGTVLDHEELIPISIAYTETSRSSRTILKGAITNTPYLTASFEDPSSISSIMLYVDDELKASYTFDFLDNRYIDSAIAREGLRMAYYGEYKIIAKDALGNQSEFTFENLKSYKMQYTVDGEEEEIPASSAAYFDKGEYTKIEYGGERMDIKLYDGTTVLYMITKSNGKKVFLYYSIKDGGIYELSIQKITDYETIDEVQTPFVSIETVEKGCIFTKTGKKAGSTTSLAKVSLNGVNVEAWIDVDGQIVIGVLTDETNRAEILDIQAKVMFDDETLEPIFMRAILSSHCSDIELVDKNGNPIETNQDGHMICISEQFNIKENAMTDDIVEVKLGFSQVNVFESFDTIYTKGDTFAGIKCEEDGFYKITILNIYGNTTTYVITMSSDCMIIGTALYADGSLNSYSKDYEEKLYSNYGIMIEAIANIVSFELTKNGKPYTKEMAEEGTYLVESRDKYFYSEFYGDGNYVWTVEDEYGNVITREFEICAKQLEFDESLLYGYNEKALKKSEGYTNTALSISANSVERNQLQYACVTFGKEDKIVIFDFIAENKNEIEEGELEGCVGTLGSGVYTVIFKDIYGNSMKRDIHYSDTSTLSITRRTKSSTAIEEYSTELAEMMGIWSNMMVTFNTASTKYALKVDGKERICPVELSMPITLDEGEMHYTVYYVDEYGFNYNFNVTLIRQKLQIELDSSVKSQMIDSVLTTRQDFCLAIDEAAALCRYTINNDEYDVQFYQNGALLHRDGTYRFTVEDLAGNVAKLTVKKDTRVEYSFVESINDKVLLNGGVTTTNSVTFKANNYDTAYIKSAIHDGVEVKDYTNKFSQDGKWEIIVADKVGNEDYFCFYIMTHAVNQFSYKTPYQYKITDVLYTGEDNVCISYITLVEQFDTGSSFSFADQGQYTVIMKSIESGISINFSFDIDTKKPDVHLNGCNEHESTVNTVTIDGLKSGDTVFVYKDGKLVSTTHVTATVSSPQIVDGGNYKVVVRSLAGNETTLEFTRIHIANTPGSVLIIIMAVLAAVGLFVGLIYRNRSKVDK